MPIKFRKSESYKAKGGGTTTNHYYIKQLSNSKLFEMLNSLSTRPKIKVKVCNELARRKVPWCWKKDA